MSVIIELLSGRGYPPCPNCGAARNSFPGSGWPEIREACPACGAALWLERGPYRDGGDWGPFPTMLFCCDPTGSLVSPPRALAVRRANCERVLHPYYRVIIYDWPGGPDGDWGAAFPWPSHEDYWTWVASAPVQEIVDWAERAPS
jgi:hypothetical protein